MEWPGKGRGRRGIGKRLAVNGRTEDLPMTKAQVRGAEGVGLEPTSPFGQRFSSVWPNVLSGSSHYWLGLSFLVNECVTS